MIYLLCVCTVSCAGFTRLKGFFSGVDGLWWSEQKDFASLAVKQQDYKPQDSPSIKSQSQDGRIQRQLGIIYTAIIFGIVFLLLSINNNSWHLAIFPTHVATQRHWWFLNFAMWVVILEQSLWCTIETCRCGRYKELNCVLKIVLLILSKLELASSLHATGF